LICPIPTMPIAHSDVFVEDIPLRHYAYGKLNLFCILCKEAQANRAQERVSTLQRVLAAHSSDLSPSSVLPDIWKTREECGLSSSCLCTHAER